MNNNTHLTPRIAALRAIIPNRRHARRRLGQDEDNPFHSRVKYGTGTRARSFHCTPVFIPRFLPLRQRPPVGYLSTILKPLSPCTQARNPTFGASCSRSSSPSPPPLAASSASTP